MADPSYEALTSGAGLFESHDRGLLWLTGRECQSFLHNLSTNDIDGLGPGQGCYTTFLSKIGKMLADAWVMVRADGVALAAWSTHLEFLVKHLRERLVAEDVEIGEVVGYGILHLAGPRAATVLAGAGGPSGDLARYQVVDTTLGGGEDSFVFANPLYGVAGFDWIGEEEALPQARAALLAAGARPVGAEALEVIRIEQGVARYGVDLTDKNLPIEGIPPDKAVSYTKGCYLGQEIIARLKTYGTPARQLRGLRFAGGGEPPGAGEIVYAGDREAGHTTSSCGHPRLGPIGLALLKRGFYEEPGEVTVGPDRRPAFADVLPFAEHHAAG